MVIVAVALFLLKMMIACIVVDAIKNTGQMART